MSQARWLMWRRLLLPFVIPGGGIDSPHENSCLKVKRQRNKKRLISILSLIMKDVPMMTWTRSLIWRRLLLPCNHSWCQQYDTGYETSCLKKNVQIMFCLFSICFRAKGSNKSYDSIQSGQTYNISSLKLQKSTCLTIGHSSKKKNRPGAAYEGQVEVVQDEVGRWRGWAPHTRMPLLWTRLHVKLHVKLGQYHRNLTGLCPVACWHSSTVTFTISCWLPRIAWVFRTASRWSAAPR